MLSAGEMSLKEPTRRRQYEIENIIGGPGRISQTESLQLFLSSYTLAVTILLPRLHSL